MTKKKIAAFKSGIRSATENYFRERLTSEHTDEINADAFLTEPYTAEKLLKALAEI